MSLTGRPLFVEPPVESTPLIDQIVRRISFHIEVIRIEGPRGTFSTNDRLWALVDDLITDPNSLLTMRENGIRHAVAAGGKRDSFKALLDAIPETRAAWDRAEPRTDRPIEIGLRDFDADMSLFYFDRAGVMSGSSFSEAKPFFKIEFSIEAGRDTMVHLNVIPEVREPPGPMHYIRTPTGFRSEPQYRGRVFDELTMKVVMAPDSILVIGPTPEVHRLPVLGRPFFVAPDGRESLYILIPRTRENSMSWSPQGDGR